MAYIACDPRAPVAVGGIGGSGTRVVAAILKELGFYIGGDLNDANDNLWFTLLFKRRNILSENDTEFAELVALFANKMSGPATHDRRMIRLLRSLAEHDRIQHTRQWLKERVESFLDRATDVSGRVDRWGWKEPNTHVVLGRVRQHLPKMKYIHVIRNGLDMAYSDNQNQLAFWGPVFLGGVAPLSPGSSLKYWCVMQKRILSEAANMGQEFLLINFDKLCLSPLNALMKLKDFLGIDSWDDCKTAMLARYIKAPESIGRFRQHGLKLFDPSDVAYVAQLGFDTDI